MKRVGVNNRDGDGEPRKKRVIPRQARPPVEEADHIVSEIEIAEMERLEREADAVIKRRETYERMLEKRAKAAEIKEQELYERRSAEWKARRLAEREMENDRPRDLEDCNVPQFRALAQMHSVTLCSVEEASMRNDDDSWLMTWVEQFRAAGVSEPFSPSEWGALPHDANGEY